MIWHTVSYQKIIKQWLQCNIMNWHKHQVLVTSFMSKWSLRTARAVVVFGCYELLVNGNGDLRPCSHPEAAHISARISPIHSHTHYTDRTLPRPAFIHWRNKQHPEFPVCYFRCLQNKMSIYLKPWLFFFTTLSSSLHFFFLSYSPIFSALCAPNSTHLS